MNPRSLILVVVALVIAGVAAIMVRNILPSGPQQPTVVAQPVGPKILVAARDLPIGKIIDAQDLRWQSWPDNNVSESYLKDTVVNIPDFAGHVVRHGVIAGEPITRSRLVAPTDRGFMAAVLTPGMRAVTISLSPTSGIGGLAFPGDRVDVILIHQVNDAYDVSRVVGETVLKNVRILAIDTNSNDQANAPKVGKTATIEVTPKMAEEVAVAQRLGQISLSLRSLADTALTGEDAEEGPLDKGESMPSSSDLTASWDADVSALVPPLDENLTKQEVVVSRANENETVEFKRKDK